MLLDKSVIHRGQDVQVVEETETFLTDHCSKPQIFLSSYGISIFCCIPATDISNTLHHNIIPTRYKIMLELERFTFGVGDRFAHQAAAQLAAFVKIAADGVEVVPVWNKSNREHSFIGSVPASVKLAAETAVKELQWKKPWHIDADHIRLETVDKFVDSSDFFTIDVADNIGQGANESDIDAFLKRHPELTQPFRIDGIDATVQCDRDFVRRVANQYMSAVQEAGRIYRHIAEKKNGEANFIAEVSMDETDAPQTPSELLVILILLADEKIRLQTIAPKFTGRFNKGVDYVGDLSQFEREFNDDLAVIAHAVKNYGLPRNLKLSVHSGSDKFSLYPIIRRALERTGAGLHLKTAGTSWLEELIGLAESGRDGLAMVQEIYRYASEHVDEFCAPYASVIDIDRSKLPSPAKFEQHDGTTVAAMIRHIPTEKRFNPHVRQLLHVSFKVAAKFGDRYLNLLKTNRETIAHHVTENIYARHMRPLFVG